MRRLPLAILLALGPATLALAGCGSDGGDAIATKASAERPAARSTDPPGDPLATEEFCARIAGFEGGGSVDADDPAAAAAAAAELRGLAESAPEEIRDDVEVLADLFDALVAMGQDQGGGGDDDFEEMGEAFALFFDPEVIAAGEHLQAFVVEQCGIDEDSASEMFGGGSTGPPGDDTSGDDTSGEPDTTTTGPADPSDISLDDLDAIEDANAGAAWVDKVNSTSILNDEEVQLIAPATAEDFGGAPLTPEEAVAACEAVRTALEARQPKLTVEVLNGDLVVARGAAGVPCSAV